MQNITDSDLQNTEDMTCRIFHFQDLICYFCPLVCFFAMISDTVKENDKPVVNLFMFALIKLPIYAISEFS